MIPLSIHFSFNWNGRNSLSGAVLIARLATLLYAVASSEPLVAHISNRGLLKLSGEMSEWLKEHAWKVCVR